jgi:hypothetical protein
MDNEYTLFCVPSHLVFAANQLAMVVASSVADGMTFEAPNVVDADGNLYYVRNIWASKGLVPALQKPLVRPAWDVDEVIDMDAAATAQAALVFSLETVLAMPDKLTALGGPDAVVALAAMGLTAKEMPIGE